MKSYSSSHLAALVVSVILSFTQTVVAQSALTNSTPPPATPQIVVPNWSYTGNLNTARRGHTATLLQNGKVLVAGGQDATGAVLNSAELYDLATGTWRITGNLNTVRDSPIAVLLPNGKVLVTGGDGNRNTAELYDPATGTWSYTGNHNVFDLQTATLLTNGKVLFIGYNNPPELYDPSTGTWSSTGKLNNTFPYGYTATLLPNGKVLVAGGDSFGGDGSPIDSAELYDPAAGMWSITGDMNIGREFHTATLLQNGKVLVAGGVESGNTAELYEPSTNPNYSLIDDAPFFVTQHYADFLSRPPDAAGLAFWVNEVTSCNDDAQCIDIKRTNVSAAYFLSIEFQQTGYLVYRFYQASYNRQPRRAEFMPDTQIIGDGVIVTPDNSNRYKERLEQNTQAFVASFVTRDSFKTQYPTSLTNAQFVDALNTNTGNALTSEQRNALVTGLTNNTETRATVLRKIAENDAFARREFNRAFVLEQYFGYLRRNPDDAPDNNLDGYNFWLNKLTQSGGDYIKAEMVRSFILSKEYRQRFGQP